MSQYSRTPHPEADSYLDDGFPARVTQCSAILLAMLWRWPVERLGHAAFNVRAYTRFIIKNVRLIGRSIHEHRTSGKGTEGKLSRTKSIVEASKLPSFTPSFHFADDFVSNTPDGASGATFLDPIGC
jgi:hypothetical protein